MCVSEASPDQALLDGVSRGDGGCLDALYERYGAHVLHAALRILRDHGEAEEVVQDVFLHVWQQPRRFESARGSARAWLAVMARSRALDRLRANQSRGGRARFDHAPDDRADVAVFPHPDALAIREYVAAVPALQRLPLELAFFEGYSHAEIAELLKQPIGTVKTRIRLALRRIQCAMDATARNDHADASTEVPFTVALAEYLAQNPVVRHSFRTLDGVRALVVDDDSDTRALVATVLECADARVEAVSSAQDALARLDQQRPHIMIADIAMPGVNGYELVREAKAWSTHSEVPLRAVALSARSTDGAKAAALRAGFDAHLAKPTQPHTIVGLVAALTCAWPCGPTL